MAKKGRAERWHAMAKEAWRADAESGFELVHTSLSILGLRTKTTLPRSITEHAIRHMSAISASPT